MQTSVRTDFAWLWMFIAVHKRTAIGAVLCGVLAGICTGLGTALLGTIIDNIRHGVEMNRIAVYIVLLVGLTVIAATAFFGQRLFSGYVSVAVHNDVSRTLFNHLLTQDHHFYQHYPIGELISRVYSDVDLIWRLLALGLTRIGSAVLILIVAFTVLATIHLPLTLLVLTILSISATLQMRVGRILTPVFEKVQAQEGVMTALVQDAFSGIQTIKTFGREADVAAQYRLRNQEYRRRWLYFTRRNEPIGMVPNMISELTAALVVLIGGSLTLTGTLTLGNFVQFLFYLGLISTALLQLSTIYQRYQQTRGALVRLEPLLQAPKIKNAADAVPISATTGQITFEQVSVEVDGQVLLRDINLTIPAGTTVGIVGATGSGKTLLVSLIGRIIEPTQGRVLLDGVDIRQIQLDDLRQAVAYVPQSTFLFSLPLHLNVRMGGADIDDDQLNQAIYISRVSNDLPQLPQGLDTLVGERGVMLSGGQKQRVAIARAIVRDPAVLILDDALSSVDARTSADILGDLRQVLATRTSLIIAHRVATIKDADLIIVMAKGRIVEQGIHDQLLKLGGHYAKINEHELSRGESDEAASEA